MSKSFRFLCHFLQDFEEACYLLMKTGALQVTQHEVLVTEKGHRTLSFLTSMLDPFLQGYQVRETYLSCSVDARNVHNRVYCICKLE